MKIKEKVLKKIYEELQNFNEGEQENKVSDLDYNRQKIFSQIYESFIFSEHDLSEVLLKNLVNQSTSILESIYKDSLDSDDSQKLDIAKEYLDNLENKEYMWRDNSDFE